MCGLLPCPDPKESSRQLLCQSASLLLPYFRPTLEPALTPPASVARDSGLTTLPICNAYYQPGLVRSIPSRGDCSIFPVHPEAIGQRRAISGWRGFTFRFFGFLRTGDTGSADVAVDEG